MFMEIISLGTPRQSVIMLPFLQSVLFSWTYNCLVYFSLDTRLPFEGLIFLYNFFIIQLNKQGGQAEVILMLGPSGMGWL